MPQFFFFGHELDLLHALHKLLVFIFELFGQELHVF
jgi:hypothetical protein